MEELSIWEKVGVGLIMVVAVVLFLPGIRRQLASGRKGSAKEWQPVALLGVIIVLFVFFLTRLV